MKLFINGNQNFFEDIKTVQDVMEKTGMGARKAAIAVNGNFIPKGSYTKTMIKDGDNIEIITPMQGG